jgi:succinoglycan biosynthesis transport protein ExoP
MDSTRRRPGGAAAAGLGPEATGAGMLDFAEILTVIRKRLPTVLLGLAAGVATALAITMSTAPTYRATATLFVGGSAPGAGPIVGLQQAYVAPTVAPAYAELAKTRSVAKAAARTGGLQLSDVLGHVSTDIQPGVQILKVGAESGSAAGAARIANAVARALVKRVASLGSVESGALPVRVVDPATEPAAAASPRLGFSLLLGSLTGLLAGIGLALLSERSARARDRRARARARRRSRTALEHDGVTHVATRP